MRIPHNLKNQQAGGVLVITLLVTGVIGFSMASYLKLAQATVMANSRSADWNTALPMMEAGVEDALAHLNKNDTNYVRDGWQLSYGSYVVKRELRDSYYQVSIVATNKLKPVIEATGYALQRSGHGRGANAAKYVSRKVRVFAERQPKFKKGMVTKGNIDLSGNNIATDSFDSGDPLFNTGGKYDPAKKKDKGDIATNASIINSLAVGNANIMGTIATGPGGVPAIGANGTVGNKAWVTSGKIGIMPGAFTDDMNVAFPDVEVPIGPWLPAPIGGVVGGVMYDRIITTGNWIFSGSTALSGKVLITGNATVLVTSSIGFSGSGKLTIATNASLKLYADCASATISGGGVVNAAGNALNFQYFGTPKNTSVSISGNGTLTGVVYAPNADFTLVGGGGAGSATDFSGASMTKSVKMAGHFNFHFDENLLRNGASEGYTVTAWNEI